MSAISQLGANLTLVGKTAPAVYADLAVLTIVVLFATIILRLGCDRMFVGEVEAAVAQGGAAAGRTAGARLLLLSISFGCGAAFIVALTPIANALDVSISHPLGGYERCALGVWLASDVIRLVVAEAQRSKGNFGKAAAASFGVRAPLYLSFLLVIVTVSHHVSRPEALSACAAASLVTLATTLPTALRDYPPFATSKSLYAAPRLQHNLLVVMTTLSAAIIGGADIWIVGSYFPSTTTARYGFAVTIVASIAILSSAVSGGLAPQLAAHLAKGEGGAAQVISVRFVRGASILAVLGYAVVLALAEPVAVSLGGAAYRGVTTYVAILGLSQVLAVMTGISGWLLIYGRHYREMMLITVGVGLLSVLLELAAAKMGLPVVLALVSGTATTAIQFFSNVVSSRRIGLRSDAFATHPPQHRGSRAAPPK